MTPNTLFNTDPLTVSWLIAIAALLVVLVAVPLLRAGIAGLLYAFAALTGRRHLRTTAARVMPRIAHLIGGLVIGTAAVAAPAMAAVEAKADVASIDLDRDAGASRATITAPTEFASVPTVTEPAPKPTSTPQPRTSAAQTPAPDPQVQAGAKMYVVRTGDTLWDIAAEHLDDPTDAEITEAWKSIWRANRAVIGDEPGLIHPGQSLDLGTLA